MHIILFFKYFSVFDLYTLSNFKICLMKSKELHISKIYRQVEFFENII